MHRVAIERWCSRLNNKSASDLPHLSQSALSVKDNVELSMLDHLQWAKECPVYEFPLLCALLCPRLGRHTPIEFDSAQSRYELSMKLGQKGEVVTLTEGSETGHSTSEARHIAV